MEKNHNVSMMSCVICTEDNVKFGAVGICEHSICSLCSMRIRVKSNDKSCPLCKQAMDIVVVFSTAAKGEHSFESYGISDIDSPTAGLDIDHRARMIYVDCRKHYLEMDGLRSIVCPLRKCNLRFPSDDLLVKHLSAVHPGQVLCKLCLKNRPLFTHEQNLMSVKELKQHMNNIDLPAAGADMRHPLCLFCEENFFDSHQLYIHMKQEHQTCHLCPASYQHRFYPSIDELRTHLRSEHFICDICEAANANGLSGEGVFGSSFRHHKDYAMHMRSMHGVKNLSMSLGFHVGNSIQDRENFSDSRRMNAKGKANRLRGNRMAFLDLEMGSAASYLNNAPSTSYTYQAIQDNNQGLIAASEQHIQSQSDLHYDSTFTDNLNDDERRMQLFHLQTTAAIASAPLVPAHMRVAGRIVSGRFQKDADDLLQAAADEAALLAQSVSGSR